MVLFEIFLFKNLTPNFLIFDVKIIRIQLHKTSTAQHIRVLKIFCIFQKNFIKKAKRTQVYMSESYYKICLFIKRQCHNINLEEKKKLNYMTSHFKN